MQQKKNTHLSRQTRKICKEYMDFIEDDDKYNPNDEQEVQNNLYEKIMEAVYGKEVWDHINTVRPH